MLPKPITISACCPAVLLLMLCLPPLANGQAVVESEVVESEVVESEVVESEEADPAAEEEAWIDKTEEYIAVRAEQLAEKFDSFFGEPTDDFTRAHSRLRLRTSYQWDELDRTDFKVRLRGKLDLPLLEERAALIFEGDDDDDFGGQRLVQEDQDQAGLQVNVRKKNRHRFDLIANLRSSFELRSGVRYRYDREFTERFSTRLTADLAHDTEEDHFYRTRLFLNHKVDDENMLRWVGHAQHTGLSLGTEWATGLFWVNWLKDDRSIAYGIVANGQTEDPRLTLNYGLGFRYRTNIFRDYLFLEVEPGYLWTKLPEFDKREGNFGFALRLEMHFETDENAPSGGRLRKK